MDDARGRGSSREFEGDSSAPTRQQQRSRRQRQRQHRLLLATVLGVLVAVPLSVSVLDVSPYRITIGTAVVGALLLIGAIALPALLLSKWQAAVN